VTAAQIYAFTLMLLAASAVTLFGVAVGAFITFRLVKGKPPLPEMQRRRQVEIVDSKQNEPPKVRLPEVRA